MHWTTYDSPLGTLTLTEVDGRITGIRFPGRHGDLRPADRSDTPFAALRAQLDEYFDGARRTFDVEVELRGSEFRQAVWEQLRTIPYGETVSYGSIALALGRMDRVRAVGSAVGSTPVPIVVPCHRVIGADGSLTGFGGGIATKKFLLEHEQRHASFALTP